MATCTRCASICKCLNLPQISPHRPKKNLKFFLGRWGEIWGRLRHSPYTLNKTLGNIQNYLVPFLRYVRSLRCQIVFSFCYPNRFLLQLCINTSSKKTNAVAVKLLFGLPLLCTWDWPSLYICKPAKNLNHKRTRLPLSGPLPSQGQRLSRVRGMR